MRACLPEASNSLFLGNGDDLAPGVGSISRDGRHAVDAFNAAGLDANTFGFNEILGESIESLEEAPERLGELVAASRFAWVTANVREPGELNEVFAEAEGARRFVVENVGGVQVGITGLVNPNIEPGRPLPAELGESMRVLDPVRALRKVVPEMRAADADIVVVLSHMDEEQTLRTVRAVDGIDVAIGTHNGTPTPEPRVENGAIIAVAGPDELQALGELSLTVRDGSIESFEFRRHVPSAETPVDRDVRAVIEEYIRQG